MQSFHRMSTRITQGNRVEPTSLPLVIHLDARRPYSSVSIAESARCRLHSYTPPDGQPTLRNSGPAGSARDQQLFGLTRPHSASLVLRFVLHSAATIFFPTNRAGTIKRMPTPPVLGCGPSTRVVQRSSRQLSRRSVVRGKSAGQ